MRKYYVSLIKNNFYEIKILFQLFTANLEGPLYIQFESDNIGNDNEHGFCLDYEAPPAGGCT